MYARVGRRSNRRPSQLLITIPPTPVADASSPTWRGESWASSAANNTMYEFAIASPIPSSTTESAMLGRVRPALDMSGGYGDQGRPGIRLWTLSGSLRAAHGPRQVADPQAQAAAVEGPA